jgi:glucokinase
MPTNPAHLLGLDSVTLLNDLESTAYGIATLREWISPC